MRALHRLGLFRRSTAARTPFRPLNVLHQFGLFKRTTALAMAFGLLTMHLLIVSTGAQAAASTLYLRGDGVTQATMDATVPTSPTLPNYDPGRNADPGLTLNKGTGLATTDPTYYQTWVAPSMGADLSGQATLTLWSVVNNYDLFKRGVIEAGLYECDPDGSDCSLIASGSVDREPWNPSGDWTEDTVDFGNVTHTVPSCRALAVKLVVVDPSDDKMWFAYDTVAYPSRLDLTGTFDGTSAGCGTVFEDEAGDGLADGAVGGSNNPGVPNVDVHLYHDVDGDGVPEATDSYQTTVQTDVNGDYSLPGLTAGKYFVVVDSKTVQPGSGLDTGWVATDVWAEQTYGPAASFCADGSGGTASKPVGSCYGGRRASVSDDLTTWHSDAEHIASLTIGGGSVSGIDFGFSFNAVTMTSRRRHSGRCARQPHGAGIAAPVHPERQRDHRRQRHAVRAGSPDQRRRRWWRLVAPCRVEPAAGDRRRQTRRSTAPRTTAADGVSAAIPTRASWEPAERLVSTPWPCRKSTSPSWSWPAPRLRWPGGRSRQRHIRALALRGFTGPPSGSAIRATRLTTRAPSSRTT